MHLVATGDERDQAWDEIVTHVLLSGGMQPFKPGSSQLPIRIHGLYRNGSIGGLHLLPIECALAPMSALE
jgi:hypothetical protein